MLLPQYVSCVKKLERKKIQTTAQPLCVCSSVCIFVTESCLNRLNISIAFLKFVKYDETLIVQDIILFLYVCRTKKNKSRSITQTSIFLK